MTPRTFSNREDHLWQTIIQGVFRSYLPNLDEEEIPAFLASYLDATDPSDLPEGRLKRLIQTQFGKRIFFETPPTIPTIERTLMGRRGQPPYAVELFLAAAVAYYGTDAECTRSAGQSFWAD